MMEIETKTHKLIDIYPKLAGDYAKRLHIKKEEIPFIKKYYVADKSEVSKKDRTIISRISCKAKDRENESLLPEGARLENYRENPIVCWGHSYRGPETIIGKNLWIKKDENGLIAKTVFAKNEFADQVYRAYTEDISGTGPLLKGWSVGFIPKKWDEPKPKKDQDKEDLPEKIFTDWELLEYSAVPIPCSPGSLTLARAKGIITSKEFEEDMGKEIDVEDFEINEDEIDIEEVSLESKISPNGETEETIEERNKQVSQENKKVEQHNEAVEEYNKKIDEEDLRFELEEDAEEEVPIEKVEVTENYIRIPVSSGHDGHKIRTKTISASQGIKALYCVDCKKFKTYLFDKDKWTLAEAQAWVREHKRGLERYEGMIVEKEEMPGDMAIEQIIEKEEMRYLTKEEQEIFKKIQDKYFVTIEERLEGIESNIAEFKEGRILSTKNRTLIKEILDIWAELKSKLEELYNATEPPAREEEKEIEIEEPREVDMDLSKIKAGQNGDVINIDTNVDDKDSPKIEIDIKKLARNALKERLDKAKGKIG